MKESIRRLLYESLNEKMISDAKRELMSFEMENSEVLKKYKELKSLVDKMEYLQNIEYSRLYPAGGNNYEVRVKYPFADSGEKKYPYFKVGLGNKDIIDSMGENEKNNYIQNKIVSYLLKRTKL